MTIFKYGAYYLNNSIKYQRKGTLIGDIKKGGSKVVWFFKWPVIALSKHRKKKLVLHYLRIYSLLFIDFALAILGIVISKTLGILK